MKKCFSVLLSIILIISCLSVTAFATDTFKTSDLISDWFSHAIKFASINDYDSFATLYGDISQDEINSDYEYFRDTVYSKKYKCMFNVVSERESGQTVVDVMFYKKQSDGNGTIKYDWQTVNMYFGTYNGYAIRIPSNYFLRADYVNSNDSDYIGCFNNNEAWVKHDNGVISRATPTIRYAKLNNDGSITLIITIVNKHDTDAKVFCLSSYGSKSVVAFGKYKFNISKYIDLQTIKAKSIKSYKVTIPYSKVPRDLTANDILDCQFKLYYTYWSGDALYDGYIISKFKGQISI